MGLGKKYFDASSGILKIFFRCPLSNPQNISDAPPHFWTRSTPPPTPRSLKTRRIVSGRRWTYSVNLTRQSLLSDLLCTQWTSSGPAVASIIFCTEQLPATWGSSWSVFGYFWLPGNVRYRFTAVPGKDSRSNSSFVTSQEVHFQTWNALPGLYPWWEWIQLSRLYDLLAGLKHLRIPDSYNEKMVY